MSLIDRMRKPPSDANDEVEKWKQKYYKQLDKLDSLKQLYTQTDSNYRQALNRLA
ncbi:MAG: hypothetical protein PSN04_07105 [Methyloprofundus sp.]|nr:hypothetical protein [Methyloprofundus sp.]